MAALTRRAMFALPVALPVAAVAATLPAARPAPRMFATGGVIKGGPWLIGSDGIEAIVPLRRGGGLTGGRANVILRDYDWPRWSDADIARTLGIPHDEPVAFTDAEVAATLGIECDQPEVG